MLTLLQYFALISAFFLPWLIGGVVKFQKDGDEKKRNVCILVLIVCASVIGLTAYLAFSIAAL